MKRKKFLFGLGAAGTILIARRRAAFAVEPAPATVRVRIFAATELSAAEISALTSTVRLDASTPPTAISAHGAPLTATVTLADGSTIVRRYAGELRSSNVEGKFVLVNAVDLESYVASVMASEISPGWRPETLKAQAVAVRTYALRRMRHKHPAAFDVVDDTTNQVYRGIDGIVPALADAAHATAGQALYFDGSPADVWYHSACGGHTAASTEITGAAAPPYLRGAPDTDEGARAFCALSPYYTWRNRLSAAAMTRVAALAGATPTSVQVTERWDDGRARTVRAQAANGESREIDGHAFYARAGAVLGYKVVPSALFDIAAPADGAFLISGRGVGHGVGMCQWGAEGRARAGHDAAAILAAYFPGAALTPVTLSAPLP